MTKAATRRESGDGCGIKARNSAHGMAADSSRCFYPGSRAGVKQSGHLKSRWRVVVALVFLAVFSHRKLKRAQTVTSNTLLRTTDDVLYWS